MRCFRLHQRLVEEGPRGWAESLLFTGLRVLSALYALLLSLRDLSFRAGWREVYHCRLPVVAVGNLVAGGTGKTPLVDLLVRYATGKGLRVAVVSRGYGGTFRGKVGLVSLGQGLLMSAEQAGDEPCLLARRNPGALVLIAARRRHALEYLEARQLADLVILDDAFQHRQVARDLNLLLLDAARPFGNGLLLPAGILREPVTAGRRADLVVLSGSVQESAPIFAAKPQLRLQTTLAAEVTDLRGETALLVDFRGRKIFAFAGIARPERFFSALAACGIGPLEKLALTDHVRYSARQIAAINAAARGAEVMLTTEKDAMKLSAAALVLPCFVVALESRIQDEKILFERLDSVLKKEIPMPLSADLLEILACPKCKNKVDVQHTRENERIICRTCGLCYPVRDGIPVMLIDEASSLGAED